MTTLAKLTLLLAASSLFAPSFTAGVHAQGAPRSAGQAAPLAFRVELNGSAFARGVAVPAGGKAPRLLLDVADLKSAVDGGETASRLHVRGSSLYAVGDGSCTGCLLRVQRPVLISSAVQRIADRLYVPLEDVVRAVEGRLVEVEAPGVYGIHVGVCTWCILEPVERGGARQNP